MIHQIFNYLPLPPTVSASNDKLRASGKKQELVSVEQSSRFLASALLLFPIQQTLLLANFILLQVPHETRSGCFQISNTQ